MFRPILRLNRLPLLLNSAKYGGKAQKTPSKDTQKDADPPKTKTGEQKVFKIYRFGGTLSKEEPRLQSYDLNTGSCGTMVLDALIKIKEMDPSVTFRRSCREGICGSCAVNLQGQNKLACITEIPKGKVITIYPLPHMYVIRDLVVDMTHFFNGYNSIRPYLVRNDVSRNAQYAQSIADNTKMIGLYECVLCACCSTSCPSYWWNGRRFLGPATLLHAYRWVIDSRDEDHDRRLDELKDDFKAFRCHSIMNCTQACPKGLQPGRVITKLKRLIARIDKKPAPEIDTNKFAGSGILKCASKHKPKPPKKC